MLKNFLCLLAVGLCCFGAIHWCKSTLATGSQPASEAVAVVPAKPRAFVSETVSSSPAAHEPLSHLMEEIQNQLSTGDETAGQRVQTDLLPQLVALNPAAAGHLAETITPDAGRSDVLRSVAQAWAGTDAAGALAWAAQLSDADEQRATLANVIQKMAQSDPARAVDAAQKYQLNDGQYDVLPSLAVQWASQDLTAALAWAGNLPAGDQRDEIMARIAFVESQDVPVDAGNRVLNEIPPGPVQEEAVMTVIHQWSLKDMSGAWGWVEKFPEGALKDRALGELAVVNRQHN
jgi:hypothetical protein